MIRKQRVALAAVLLCATALLVSAQDAEEPAALKKPEVKKGPLKVGVVHLDRVFKDSLKWRDSEQRLNTIRQEAEGVLKERRRHLDILQGELEALDVGAEAYRKKEAELKRKAAELNTDRQIRLQEFDRLYDGYLCELFADLVKVTNSYGRDHQFDLILRGQKPPLEAEHKRALRIQMEWNDLLYWDEALDITDAVVERMNADYKGLVEEN